MAILLSQAKIEEWIANGPSRFSVRDIWAELDIGSPEGRQHLRVILGRLEKKAVIASNRDGSYRRLDLTADVVDWQSADPTKFLPIQLPFGIHEYCRIYPKGIIIVAAGKNQGKTAFLYDCVKLNMLRFTVDLYNSETGPESMHERLSWLNIPKPAPFRVYQRYDNFADVVHPEHLSIIDYLDLDSEVYMVGAEINAIFKKLTTGMAIIALQKPPPTVTYIKGIKKLHERDLAYGGAFTAKRSSLYITMGGHKLKLLYVKKPADPRINPNNMQWEYAFDDHGYFTNIQRYYGEDEG